MRVVDTFAGARDRGPGRVGFVATMGFLHEGHLSLVAAARSECDVVVMSLYVNGLQFGEAADLDSYPRDLERDLDLADAAGVDIVFAPDDETMYPDGETTRVSVPSLSTSMEGRFRPGHFEGVATVVTKLFAGIQPDRAYFGRKDAQQLAVVRRMVVDLALPISVVGVPIVREVDGLALSSRNVRLSEIERGDALALSASLFGAADAFEAGERSTRLLEGLVMDRLRDAHGVVPEYALVADSTDLGRLEDVDRPAFLAVAANVGPVRLIDNIHFLGDGQTVDRGVTLSETSVLYRNGDPAETEPTRGGGRHAPGD